MGTTRAKVIEKAVGFEEIISQLLSIFLEIDKDSSNSFGNKNIALSFNAKINLLVDLKIMTPKLIKDFQLFAEIRNKFAHVLYVDTFVKCFEIIPKRRKYFLEKISTDTAKNDVNAEVMFDSCFEILCSELNIWLRVTLQLISNRKSQEANKIGAIEMVRSFLQYDKTKKQKEYENFIKALQPIIDKIIPDDEFLEEYRKLSNGAKQKNKQE